MLRITPLLFMVLIMLLSCANSATSVKEQPAKEMDGKKAEMILNTLDPEAKVLSIEPARIEGLFEVIIQSGFKKGIMYLDYKGEVVFLGSIVDIATKTNLTQVRFNELIKQDMPSIMEDALVMGDPTAKHKVVVFDDPD